MFNRGTSAAESKNKPKWLAVHIYTGKGNDRDPQRINAWF
jgi:hypothetical protein